MAQPVHLKQPALLGARGETHQSVYSIQPAYLVAFALSCIPRM